jgi:hypothetical protein
LLRGVLFVPNLQKSLYSWNSGKSIGNFALIDEHILQVVRKLDRSVVINTLQSGHDFILDLVPIESASLDDDTDYMLDFEEYFLTLLIIADSHFTFPNFFILYITHDLDSGGILWLYLCNPTVLTI